VAEHRVIELGAEVTLAPGVGTIALDGERELERRGEPATVKLVLGPLTIDIDAVMAQASHRQPPEA
jgi:hypothetical protein